MKRYQIYLLMLAFGASSCAKLVEVSPPVNAFSSETVYKSDDNAIGVASGIYQAIGGPGYYQGDGGISMLSALAADELVTSSAYGVTRNAAYENKIRPSEAPLWSAFYTDIYAANTLLKGIEASPSLSPFVKQTLKGESKIMRAFMYFYLVNYFGDVPLLLIPDYKANMLAARTPVATVYEQIIADLKDAEELLPEHYFLSDLKTLTTERIRPNKWAAKALLSRVYLYTGNYEEAERKATEVISNTAMYDTVPLQQVFLKNNKEAIFQVQATHPVRDTWDAVAFIMTNGPSSGQPAWLSESLLGTFSSGDRRREEWVGTYETSATTYRYVHKYKVLTANTKTEYFTVLRLAEQYLIRAEARAMLGNIDGAQADLNVIRKRAGLGTTAAATQAALLSAIADERRVELFAEWGHRWLDLKRTGKIGEAMKQKHAGEWDSQMELFPIPSLDMERNPNLTPNPGY